MIENLKFALFYWHTNNEVRVPETGFIMVLSERQHGIWQRFATFGSKHRRHSFISVALQLDIQHFMTRDGKYYTSGLAVLHAECLMLHLVLWK